jgi:hypothetical protein
VTFLAHIRRINFRQNLYLSNKFLEINNNYIISNKIRDSVVGIATAYDLDDRGVGVRVPIVSRIFSFPRRPDRP